MSDRLDVRARGTVYSPGPLPAVGVATAESPGPSGSTLARAWRAVRSLPLPNERWWGAMMPAIALATLVALTWLLLGAAVECNELWARWLLGVQTCQPVGLGRTAGGETPFAELTARLFWAITVLAAVLAIGGAVWAAFASLARVADVRHRRLLRLLVGASIAGMALHYSQVAHGTSYAFTVDLLVPTVYSRTGAAWFVTLVEVLGKAALVALAVTVGVVLHHAGTDHRNHALSVDQRASALAADIRAVRLLLLLGAAGLAAAALETSALYAWAHRVRGPSHYIAAPEHEAQLMGVILGGYYSLLLAAIFAPALFRLNQYANRTADAAPIPDGTRAAWMQQKGMEVSLPRQLISALAVLAPLIAGGPLATLIGALPGK